MGVEQKQEGVDASLEEERRQEQEQVGRLASLEG